MSKWQIWVCLALIAASAEAVTPSSSPLELKIRRRNDFGGISSVELHCQAASMAPCRATRTVRGRVLFEANIPRAEAMTMLNEFFSAIAFEKDLPKGERSVLNWSVRQGKRDVSGRLAQRGTVPPALATLEAKLSRRLKAKRARRPGENAGLERTPPPPGGFCEDPYRAVCGEDSDEPTERDTLIAQAQDRIKGVALAAAAQVAGADPAGFDEASLDALKRQDKRLHRKAHAAYIQRFQAEIERETNTDHPLAQFHFNEIVARMKPTITQLPTDGPTKNRMMSAIGRVKIISAGDFLAKKVSQEDFDEFLKTCGENGLLDNAYAVPVAPDAQPSAQNPYFVVCPGALLAALTSDDKERKSKDELMGKNLYMMAHEMGHHVDSDQFKGVFDRLEACLQTNYGGEFAQGGPKLYMSEITADTWALENLAQYLPKVQPPAAREELLKDGLKFLCGTPEDDPKDFGPDEEPSYHPTGKFRIDYARRYPRIAKLLCEKRGGGSFPDHKPACTVNGALSPNAREDRDSDRSDHY